MLQLIFGAAFAVGGWFLRHYTLPAGTAPAPSSPATPPNGAKPATVDVLHELLGNAVVQQELQMLLAALQSRLSPAAPATK